MRRRELEVCIDRLDAIDACVAGGADRIELCSALALGGLTPSAGALAAARSRSLPVHVLIRPRSGDFRYDGAEVEAMCADIATVASFGLAGVVIGAGGSHGLDLPIMRRLCAAATGLELSLHRVIDLVDDVGAAIEQAVALGMHRVLSSGGAERAIDGAARLADMQRIIAGRLRLAAGAGIEPDHVAQLTASAGAIDIHASCSRDIAVDGSVAALGFATPMPRRTDAARVRALRSAVDACAPSGV